MKTQITNKKSEMASVYNFLSIAEGSFYIVGVEAIGPAQKRCLTLFRPTEKNN
jgi:hypothetical protein